MPETTSEVDLPSPQKNTWRSWTQLADLFWSIPLSATRSNTIPLITPPASSKSAFKRAIEINENVYGPEHPKVATNINSLGLVLKDLSDLASAKSAFERALEIDENIYGSNHPHVARDINNLSTVLQGMGDLAGAKSAFERAIEIGEKVYGPDHLEVAIFVNNLGGVLRDKGDFEGARKYQ